MALSLPLILFNFDIIVAQGEKSVKKANYDQSNKRI